MGERPVIGFLTDFGLDGAAAICKGVMLAIARDAQIVDIVHSVGKFAIRDGAYLLWTAVPWLPIGVHVAIVDPGVGTGRRPIGLRTERGDVLIGPDNGLLQPAARRLGGIAEARLLDNPTWLLPRTSATFHGRDVFAPVAAHLAIGEPFGAAGPPIAADTLVDLRLPEPRVTAGALQTSVVYVDSFGNLRLAGGAPELREALGRLQVGTRLALTVADRDAPAHGATWSRTFGDVGAGELLAYEDSSGNLALAVSSGSAAARLGAASGMSIGIRLA